MASQTNKRGGIKGVVFRYDLKDDTQNSSDGRHNGTSILNGETSYFLSDICDHYRQDPSFFW